MANNSKKIEKVALSFYLPKDMAKKLDQICKDNYRSRTGQIEKWIEETQTK